mgnify:FL=1
MCNLAGSFSSCIMDLENWMTINRRKLNGDKTEFIWMVSKGRFRSLQNSVPSINVGNNVIATSTGARNLGVFFDRHLDMRQHIY